MKRTANILLAASLAVAALAAALASCTRVELSEGEQTGSKLVLKAYFDDAASKTTLVDGTKVYWTPGDAIKVFSGSSSARFEANISGNAAVCEFSGSIPKASSYYAAYPYSDIYGKMEGGVYSNFLTSAQVAVEGNVDSRYLFSAAASDENGLAFKNLVSGICFSLEGEGVEYVTLQGNDGETICGKFNVSGLGTSNLSVTPASEGNKSVSLNAPEGYTLSSNTLYYLVCLPTTFEKGFTLELCKKGGATAKFVINDKVELKRSVFGRALLVDKGLSFKAPEFPQGQLPPDNEIWYMTVDGAPLEFPNNQGDAVLESNTYEGGMGVLRFSDKLTRLPSRLTDYAYYASQISALLLPDCVEFIRGYFCFEMSNLIEFRVPASLKEAGSYAFSIYGDGKGGSLERFTGDHVSDDGRCLIIDGVLYGFAAAGVTDYTVPDGVTKLTMGSLANTFELKSVVLPPSVTTLDMDVFHESAIETLTLPASVKSMDHYALGYTRKLKTILGDCPLISADRKYLHDPKAMLGDMMFYFIGKDDESYSIPEGIDAIENYTFHGCDKLKSVTFPQSLSYIAGDAFFECDAMESLYGYHTTKDHKGYVNDAGSLMYLVPNIDADFVVPDEVTAIGGHVFERRPTLRSVTMGDQVTKIGDYAFQGCDNLKTITLSSGLVSFGYNPFYGDEKLEAVYFRSLVPPVYSDTQFRDMPYVKFYVPSRTYDMYKSSSDWKDYWNVMVPFEYTDIPEPDYYVSSDFSKEGEITVYQKASEGNGVDVVFMGDGYSDRQVASGAYRADMEKCAEGFFAIEPYKSLRNLFNIYFVTTVSATEGYERGGRSLGSARGMSTYISGNDAKCFELAKKAVGESKMDNVLVAVCGNQDLDGQIYLNGTCFMYNPENWNGRDYACGPAVTYFTKQDADFSFTSKLLQHEAGGHGFAKLADEYFYGEAISWESRHALDTIAKYRWYSNVDIVSDPAKVKWSQFLSDSRYAGEGLGVYQGGYTYAYGVWRPTETSIMDNDEGDFNAPSRYTIWYRINKLAYGDSWNGSTAGVYEDFVKYDAVNRGAKAGSMGVRGAGAPASGGAGAVVLGGSSIGRGVLRSVRQLPAPVYTGRTWREAKGSAE